MKLKEGVVVSNLDDGYVAIDTNISKDRFNGMVKMNSTTKLIIEYLKEDLTGEELINLVSKHYNIDSNKIKDDVHNIIKQLKGIGYIVS